MTTEVDFSKIVEGCLSTKETKDVVYDLFGSAVTALLRQMLDQCGPYFAFPVQPLDDDVALEDIRKIFQEKFGGDFRIWFGNRSELVSYEKFNLLGALEAFGLDTTQVDRYIFDGNILLYKYEEDDGVIPMEVGEEVCPVCRQVGDSTTFLLCSKCPNFIGHSRCTGYGDTVPEYDVYCENCRQESNLVNLLAKQVSDTMSTFESYVMTKEDLTKYLELCSSSFVYNRNQKDIVDLQNSTHVAFAVPKDWISLEEVLNKRKFSPKHAEMLCFYLEHLSGVQDQHFVLRRTPENKQPIDVFGCIFFTPEDTLRVIPCGFIYKKGGRGENCVRVISEHIANYVQRRFTNKIGKKGYEVFTSFLVLAELVKEKRPLSAKRIRAEQEEEEFQAPFSFKINSGLATLSEAAAEVFGENLGFDLSVEDKDTFFLLHLLEDVFGLSPIETTNYADEFYEYMGDSLDTKKALEWYLSKDFTSSILSSCDGYFEVCYVGIFDAFKNYIRTRTDELDVLQFAKDFLATKNKN